MGLTGSLTLIDCPMCGEAIIPTGLWVDEEPEYWALKCPRCQKMIEVRRDPVSGKLISKKVNPS